MHHFPHSTYYQDRQTEYQLCQDFPGDDVLIDGLHAMQLHFQNNNVNVDIPVVRIMNTAHFLAAYMFSTECSGDQLEYDAIAHDSLSRDIQLTRVAMIVLAAMLKRTQGFRASSCRNLILENREPDFDYGVTLYDRFLRSAEKRFSEENFLIDTHAQILALKSENTRLTSENLQLTSENKELQIKYHIMEEKYQQINIGTQNNNCTINNFFGYNPTSTSMPTDQPQNNDASHIPPDFFCISSRFTEENIRERIDAELSIANTKIEFCRSLYRLQHMGCININQYASDAQRANVLNRFQNKFKLSASDFCKARMTK